MAGIDVTEPEPIDVQTVLDDAHARFADDTGGAVSALYPPLAEADPEVFGLAFSDVDGASWMAGDASVPFVLMSVAKPFTFALACDVVGIDVAAERIGVDATGMAFNSLEAVERRRGPGNPMVNAGAIATVSLLGDGPWPLIIDTMSRFAGRGLSIDDDVFASVMVANHHNRSIIHLLEAVGSVDGSPEEILEAYTRQCCITVTPADLASMGATLANGGVNPATGERVVSGESCRAALAVMVTAGLYETSGEWLYRVQLPGKSGVSGGMVGVSPGRGAFATYSPRIDSAANSVRGQLAAEYVSERLGLGILGRDAG